MTIAHSDQPLNWLADAGVSPAMVTEPFWRSLFFFNVYRLVVASLLLFVVAVWGRSLHFGSQNLTLFIVAASLYFLFSLVGFALIKIRWYFSAQLSVQVVADITFMVILIYTSGGISSGLGLLLLATLAGAGLISRGRLTLFYAALASIAVLLEHTYEVLAFDASVTQYLQAGLLSVGYFATAGVAHTLAKYTLASEQLAAQREIDLENLAEVNKLVIQDMHDGVLVVDAKGVIRQFNTRAERILGPLRGRREVVLNDYAPELASRLAAWRNDSAAFDSASAMEISPALGARFVPVGGSRLAGAVIFLEDLTRIQAEARQLKLAALGRLTVNIAHEVRNPLGAVSHAAELLQEEPAISDTATRLLSIIHDNTRRLDRMVNNVLRLNRGDRAHRETFQVVEYLMNFVDQFCQIEKIAPEIFEIGLAADPYIQFDRSHLDQVMWNLCRNALRHCKQQKASIRIMVASERGGSVVRLDVVDDGPGVPGEMRAQLFEPFFTTAQGGTGLGLYIAREVCEANGATLDYVEDAEGARFSVLGSAG